MDKNVTVEPILGRRSSGNHEVGISKKGLLASSHRGLVPSYSFLLSVTYSKMVRGEILSSGLVTTLEQILPGIRMCYRLLDVCLCLTYQVSTSLFSQCEPPNCEAICHHAAAGANVYYGEDACARIRCRQRTGKKVRQTIGHAKYADCRGSRSHIFDGKNLTKETAAFQLCDIEDPMLKEMIDDPDNMQEECDVSLLAFKECSSGQLY